MIDFVLILFIIVPLIFLFSFHVAGDLDRCFFPSENEDNSDKNQLELCFKRVVELDGLSRLAGDLLPTTAPAPDLRAKMLKLLTYCDGPLGCNERTEL